MQMLRLPLGLVVGIALGASGCRALYHPPTEATAPGRATVFVTMLSLSHPTRTYRERMEVNGRRFDATAPRVYQGPGRHARRLVLPADAPARLRLTRSYLHPRGTNLRSDPSCWRPGPPTSEEQVAGLVFLALDAAIDDQAVTECRAEFELRPEAGGSYQVEYRFLRSRRCEVRCRATDGGACPGFTGARAKTQRPRQR